MANYDLPSGARPAGRVRSANMYVAGGTIYPGDFVRLASDGKIDAAAAGDTLLGVALEYGVDTDSILVSDHEDQRYVLQSDSADIDAQTDIGNLFDILATAGNSTYKQSRMELDGSTVSTASGQLVLLGIEGRVADAFGANVKCIVKIAEHQIVETFAGV